MDLNPSCIINLKTQLLVRLQVSIEPILMCFFWQSLCHKTKGQFQTRNHLQCRQHHTHNCPQTWLNTMHGRKRRWWMTSAEHGTAITLQVTANALGNSLPTLLLFPRIKIRNCLSNGVRRDTKVVCHPNCNVFSENDSRLVQHSEVYIQKNSVDN
jgi:hypothetical protein